MLYRVTLHLARNPEFPGGSAQHSYEIVAPLDADGHLDGRAWDREREFCAVRRVWAGEPDRLGQLLHRAGGAGGATWIIDYDDASLEDDERGYRFDRHIFVPGEYVTLSDPHGAPTFRIIDVEPSSQQPI